MLPNVWPQLYIKLLLCFQWLSYLICHSFSVDYTHTLILMRCLLFQRSFRSIRSPVRPPQVGFFTRKLSTKQKVGFKQIKLIIVSRNHSQWFFRRQLQYYYEHPCPIVIARKLWTRFLILVLVPGKCTGVTVMWWGRLHCLTRPVTDHLDHLT